jgi:PAS domain S-box-containing protein
MNNKNKAFLALDRALNIIYVDENFATLFKKNKGTLIGQNFWEQFPYFKGSVLHEQFISTFKDKQANTFCFFSDYLQQNLEFCLSASAETLEVFLEYFSKEQTFVQSNKLFQDFKVKKDWMNTEFIEQSKKVAEEHFCYLLDAAPAMIWLTDTEKFCSFVNSAWCKFTGCSLEQEIGSGWLESIHLDCLEHTLHVYNSAFEQRKPFSVEYLLKNYNGEYRWILDCGLPRYGVNGEFTGYIGSCTDITEEKQAKELLVNSEKELADFWENANIGLQLVNGSGIITRANKALCDMLGYTQSDYIGQPLNQFFADKKIVQEIFEKLFNKESLNNVEAELKAKDGSSRYVLISTSGLWKSEQFSHSRCFVKDITVRKQTQDSLAQLHHELESRVFQRTAELEKSNRALKRALIERKQVENIAKRSNDFSKNLVQSSLDGICVIDLNFNYKVWNGGMEAISGFSKQQVLGRNVFEVFPFLKEIGEDEYWKTAFQGQSIVAKDRPYSIPATGKKGYYEAHYSPLTDESGKITGGIAIVRETTERKTFEEALIESEKRFRSYFELPLVGISIAGAEANLIEVNDKICEIFGYTREELVYKSWQELTHPDDLDLDLGYFKRVLNGEIDNYSLEKRYIRKDGKILYAIISTSCVRDSSGAISYFVTLVQDITYRKKTEEALRRSEERFRSYFELPLIGIAITSPNTGWIEVNNKLCDMLGYSRAELMKLTWPELTHKNDLMKDVEHFNKILSGESEGYSVEKRFIRKDGSIIYANYSTRCIRDREGSIDYFVALMQDISDRKAFEEQLHNLNLDLENRVTERTKQLEEVSLLKDELLIRAQKALLKAEISEQNYRFLAESIPQIVWTATTNGYLDYYNQRWFEYTGLSEEQSLAYEGWENILHPEDVNVTKESWYRSVANGEEFHIENRLKRSTDGSYRWHLARALPLKNEDGNIIKWFGTYTDIDDHKRAEEKLRLSEQRFRKLVDANIIGVMIVDLDGSIHEANEAFLKMVGYDRDDLVSGKMQWTNMTPPQYVQLDKEKVSALTKDGILPPFEKEYIRKDGTTVPVLVGGALLERDKGMTVAFVLDISERKELEQRKDEFIGMASHELKTPVTSLKIFTQMLIKMFEKKNDPQSLLFLRKADDQINKLTKLISDLLDISKMQVGKLQFRNEVFAIDNLIEEIVENSQLSYKQHSIKIIGSTGQTLSADKDRIEQVLINLISNAVKYSPEADQVFVKINCDQNNSIVVSVQDFGIGIDIEDQAKIFDRFFRVSDVEKKNMTFPGFGIGLYIASEIVRHHKGKIWVESIKGQGTTISFSLPIVNEALTENSTDLTSDLLLN